MQRQARPPETTPPAPHRMRKPGDVYETPSSGLAPLSGSCQNIARDAIPRSALPTLPPRFRTFFSFPASRVTGRSMRTLQLRSELSATACASSWPVPDAPSSMVKMARPSGYTPGRARQPRARIGATVRPPGPPLKAPTGLGSPPRPPDLLRYYSDPPTVAFQPFSGADAADATTAPVFQPGFPGFGSPAYCAIGLMGSDSAKATLGYQRPTRSDPSGPDPGHFLTFWKSEAAP